MHDIKEEKSDLTNGQPDDNKKVVIEEPKVNSNDRASLDSLNQQSGETSYDFEDSSESLNNRANLNLGTDDKEDIIRIPSFRNPKKMLRSDSSEENPSDSDSNQEEEEEEEEKKSSDSSEIIVPTKLIEISKFHRGITKKQFAKMNTKGIAFSDGSDEDKPKRNTLDLVGFGGSVGSRSRRIPIYQIPEEEQDDDIRS